MHDPFEVLGVAPDASDEEIRRSYLKLVRIHTPDRAPERFAEIRAAYEKLHDPISRANYLAFEAGRDDSLEAVCNSVPTVVRRPPFSELLRWGQCSL